MLQLPTYPYTPILGWSCSRYDTFRSCQRQYYYQYYGKHDLEVPRHRIDALKALTTIPMEIGSTVHGVIADILRRQLKSGREIHQEKFREFVRRKTELACRRKSYAEVHYGETAEVIPEDLLSEVEACLGTFLQSERYGWISTKARKSGETWLIEPPGYGETRLDGMKAYVKVDFLFVVDGRVVIIDWKTGKRDEEKHGKQLLGYGAWAMYHLGRAAPDIDAYVAYLKPTYEEVHVRPTEEELRGFVGRVRRETEEMYAVCGDVQENVPLEKQEFPLTEHTGLCRFCNFRELCSRM